jgi:probable rRNA maturation factor
MSRPRPTMDAHELAGRADTQPASWLDVVIDDAVWTELGPVEIWIADAAAVLARHPRSRAKPHMTAVIALSTDAAVAQLNNQYRGISKPTNVLSFPAGPQAGAHLGDIILARQTVATEAECLNIPIAHHIQHLTIHGLLHLLGFDHEAEVDAADMEAFETELLGLLGVADPYAERDA